MKRSLIIFSVSLCLILGLTFAYFNGTLGQAYAEGEGSTDAVTEETWEARWEKAGVYGPTEGLQTYDGNVTVLVPGVELQNMVIVGNMVLDPGVGTESVVLRNVTITGDLVVLGGGSVSLKDSQVQTLKICKPEGAATVTAEGRTFVWSVRVESEAQLEEMVPPNLPGFGHIYYANNKSLTLTGDFPTLTLEQQGGPINLLAGKVGKVYVESKAAGAILSLNGGTEVSVLDIFAPLQVKGTGTVIRAVVLTDGAEMSTAPQHYEFAEGKSIIIAGETVNEQTLQEPEPEPEPEPTPDPQPKPEPQKPKPQQPVQPSIVIQKLSGMMLETGKSGSQKVTVSPGDAKIEVTSSNSNVATVSVSGNTITVTAKAAGSATVTVKASKSDYKSAGASFTVTVKAPLTASVQSVEKLTDSPMPAMTSFRVWLKNTDPSKTYTVTAFGITFKQKSGGYYEYTVESVTDFAKKTDAEIKSAVNVVAK